MITSISNKGFTLIELIIVIVILGIMAVTAAPRFIDISSDANIAKLKALEGTIKSGANLVRAKAIVQGLYNRNGFIGVDIDNDGNGDVMIFSSYLAVGGQCSFFISGLPYWIDINLPVTCISGVASSDDWYGIISTQTFDFMPAGITSISQGCYLRYTEPLFFGGSFSTSLITSGC
jgi:MSHA pilin protein MshA